jgi:hypothetical protein
MAMVSKADILVMGTPSFLSMRRNNPEQMLYLRVVLRTFSKHWRDECQRQNSDLTFFNRPLPTNPSDAIGSVHFAYCFVGSDVNPELRHGPGIFPVEIGNGAHAKTFAHGIKGNDV